MLAFIYILLLGKGITIPKCYHFGSSKVLLFSPYLFSSEFKKKKQMSRSQASENCLLQNESLQIKPEVYFRL